MLKLKQVNEDLVFLFVILGATLLMVRPLWHSGLLFAHDAVDYFSKAVAVHQSWREGDLLARWSPHINAGYGYPNLNFYSPLFSYIAAGFMFFFPLALGFHVAMIFCLFLSGVSMYFFAREIWGRQGGLLSAVAYLFAPYHILDIYVRAAVGEATAFIFSPLILLALYRLSRKVVVRDILIGVLGVAGLILSHPLATFIFLPWALGYAIFLSGVPRRFEPRKWLAAGCVFGGALLLIAYFVLPSLLEQKFVQIERFLMFDYRNQFIHLSQILYSPWGLGGFGGTGPEFCFMVGTVHGLAALVLLIFWRRAARAVEGAGRQILFFSVCFVAAVFFTLSASAPLWKWIPRLAYVQFPWRFLMLATLALSSLSGGVICVFPPRFRKIALVAGCALFVCFNLSYCRVFKFRAIPVARSSEAYVRTLRSYESGGFLPKWVRNKMPLTASEKLQTLQGLARVSDDGGRPLDRRFHVQAALPALLCFHSYYFPGWEVLVNGNPVEIFPNNPSGLILFLVPPGVSSVRVHFGTTPVRQWGDIVSLVTLLFLALIVIFRKRVDAWLEGGTPRL